MKHWIEQSASTFEEDAKTGDEHLSFQIICHLNNASYPIWFCKNDTRNERH